ncbi:response regulator [Azospirillum rugosum]|uniref:CheY-like chemotaxis protein n=1 Tax=Azospirillum rugosum TaxID=416170 RepID=A0ABS4SGG7_9PROT|nr:response regulator [Azospirillum rugosum]MBP2290530.1 CheY-like chemotaxis protein [Azospirillum rugosum]MDQ0525418.1 CheY-like chemotaxis protein [Azospirillum rugosum]
MSTVMVVEHDAVLRARMADALRKAGFDVEEVAGGQAALARLNEGVCPALILLGLNLQDPGMNGWEFRAALLQDPDLAHMPVCVVIDAGTEEETAERLCAAGVLRHPVKDAQLVRMAHRCAGHAAPDDDGA